MPTIPNRDQFERGGFILFLAFISISLAIVVWPFASSLLWAMLAAIMFQPLNRWLVPYCGGRVNVAAIATLAIITIAVVIPAFVIGSMVVDQAAQLYVAFRDGQIDVAQWFTQIRNALPAGMRASLASSGWGTLDAFLGRAQDLASESTGVIVERAVAIGGSALGFVLAFGIGLYVTFFLLRDGPEVGEAIIAGMPIKEDIARQLADKFLAIVRATIKGSVVVGLVQGALGAITFWIAGVPSVMLLGLLMAIFSLLPALGPAIIWLPVAIWLLAAGEVWQGIVVLVSGVLIIGMADNVLRPILVGRDTGIPDWVVLVTTLGGIALFGISGIILGPLIAGLFLAAWSISRTLHVPQSTA